jgi:hypothetical protein
MRKAGKVTSAANRIMTYAGLIAGKNRIMIYGAKDDATYVLEFMACASEEDVLGVRNAAD